MGPGGLAGVPTGWWGVSEQLDEDRAVWGDQEEPHFSWVLHTPQLQGCMSGVLPKGGVSGWECKGGRDAWSYGQDWPRAQTCPRHSLGPETLKQDHRAGLDLL